MNLYWANFAENSIKAGMKEIKTTSLLPQAFFEEPFEFRPTIEVNFFGRYSFTTKKLFNYYNLLVSATSNIVLYLEGTLTVIYKLAVSLWRNPVCPGHQCLRDPVLLKFLFYPNLVAFLFFCFEWLKE